MPSTNSIDFFFEDTDFVFPEEKKTKDWLAYILLDLHSIVTYQLTYIFCSDKYLLKINKEHLNHDYYTDIITFPLEVSETSIQSDLFISYDRVKDNAANHGEKVNRELRRVMIHGILHMLGFSDKTVKEQEKMRAKENEMLALF